MWPGRPGSFTPPPTPLFSHFARLAGGMGRRDRPVTGTTTHLAPPAQARLPVWRKENKKFIRAVYHRTPFHYRTRRRHSVAKAAAVTLADRGARSGQYFPRGERGGVCSGLVIPPLGPLQHNEIIRDTQLHRLTNTSISYSIYAEPCRGLSGRRWNGKTDVGRKGHGKVVQCQAPLSIRRQCVPPPPPTQPVTSDLRPRSCLAAQVKLPCMEWIAVETSDTMSDVWRRWWINHGPL